MKISAIIPCFNAAAFLPHAVASVVDQGVEETEIIIVDDASTDDTLVVAAKLSREVKNIRIIRRALNEGAGRARNIGLREAKAGYVCFLDADDAYGEGAFTRSISVLDAKPWIHAVTFRIRLVNCHRPVAPNHLRRIENCSATNLITRSDFARALGGFPTDPRFYTAYGGQDVAFRVALNRWGRVHRLDDVFLEHTVRRSSHFDKNMDDLLSTTGPADPAAHSLYVAALKARAEWVERRMLARLGLPASSSRARNRR